MVFARERRQGADFLNQKIPRKVRDYGAVFLARLLDPKMSKNIYKQYFNRFATTARSFWRTCWSRRPPRPRPWPTASPTAFRGWVSAVSPPSRLLYFPLIVFRFLRPWPTALPTAFRERGPTRLPVILPYFFSFSRNLRPRPTASPTACRG